VYQSVFALSSWVFYLVYLGASYAFNNCLGWLIVLKNGKEVGGLEADVLVEGCPVDSYQQYALQHSHLLLIVVSYSSEGG
jgi:hypothetical protein